MAPIRTQKMASDPSSSISASASASAPLDLAAHKIPTKSGNMVTTPQRSPIRKRKKGISLPQKQALIDNLQLESRAAPVSTARPSALLTHCPVTERARRLRAQYNLQAQSLRSRIEIRVYRIPDSLRRVKMGDLLHKYAEQQKKLVAATRPPPVPEKDVPPRITYQKPTYTGGESSQAPASGRVHKRTRQALAVTLRLPPNI